MEEKEPLLRIQPKFNFIYEMFMPTGRKIKSTLLMFIVFAVCYFFVNIALNNTGVAQTISAEKTNIDISGIINFVFVAILFILVVKFVINLVVQILQYKSIKYTFYDDYLEYEDTFLNQHKKSIRYSNVKEIEIRRTVWDRINGYGIIIIYSNAEKISDKGLIIYSIKDTEETYSRIDEIIHKKTYVQTEKVEPINGVNPADIATEEEIEFRESLNNKE